MSAALAGRAGAAVGVACGFAAIWVDAFPPPAPGGSKADYWADGTFAAAMLIALSVSALLIAGAFATGRRDFDLAAPGVGALAWGLFAFAPTLIPLPSGRASPTVRAMS